MSQMWQDRMDEILGGGQYEFNADSDLYSNVPISRSNIRWSYRLRPRGWYFLSCAFYMACCADFDSSDSSGNGSQGNSQVNQERHTWISLDAITANPSRSGSSSNRIPIHLVDGAMATAPRTSSTHGFLILVRSMNMILSNEQIKKLNYRLSVNTKRIIIECLSSDTCCFCSLRDECQEVCNQTFCGSQVPCEYVIHKLFEAVVK